jgi:hypothetical protein
MRRLFFILFLYILILFYVTLLQVLVNKKDAQLRQAGKTFVPQAAARAERGGTNPYFRTSYSYLAVVYQ